MRHRKRVKKLGRTASHRQAVLANLASAIIDKERIQTTNALAKESRKLVERLITKAKMGTLHARRQVLKIIKDKKIVAKLFETVAPRYADRNGGYVRLIRVGNRPGDGAALSIVELIGSELVVEDQKKAKKKKRKKVPREETEEISGATPEAVEAEDEEGGVEKIGTEVQEEEVKEESSSEERDDEKKLTEEPEKKDSDTASESTAAGKDGEGKGERPDK